MSEDPIIQAWYARLLEEAPYITGPAKMAIANAVTLASGSPQELETVLVLMIQKTKNDMRLTDGSRNGMTVGYRLALRWLREEMGLVPGLDSES